MTDTDLFNPASKNRALRALLIGLILGSLTGTILGGLAMAERISNG